MCDHRDDLTKMSWEDLHFLKALHEAFISRGLDDPEDRIALKTIKTEIAKREADLYV